MQQKKGTFLIRQIILDSTSVKCTRRTWVSVKIQKRSEFTVHRYSLRNHINRWPTRVFYCISKTQKNRKSLFWIRQLMKRFWTQRPTLIWKRHTNKTSERIINVWTSWTMYVFLHLKVSDSSQELEIRAYEWKVENNFRKEKDPRGHWINER